MAPSPLSRPSGPACQPVDRLREIAEELRNILSGLDERANPDQSGSEPGGQSRLFPVTASDDLRATPNPRHLVATARQIYAMRRRRAAVFGGEDLFGEPAWDMLLDLYISEHEGKRLPVTSACIGANVPVTTGLRWLTILEKRGLVLRESDPGDARRTYIRISPGAIAAMHDVLAHHAALVRP